MDQHYILNGISFAWDRRKATTNRQKHQVDFEQACEAFFDPFVYYLTNETIGGEQREAIIGLTARWQLLIVVYVMREDGIRLISARTVTKAEREQYENQ